MSRPNVAVLGAGRFADAVVRILKAAGADMRVWARTDAGVERIAAEFDGLWATTDLAEVAAPADIVFFAVPASAMLEVSNAFGAYARGDQIVIHAIRGVGPSFLLPHAAIRKTTCIRQIGCLAGPLHARELGSGRPLAAVLASRYPGPSNAIRALAKGTPVRVHPSMDLIGVEVAGAISNASALATGMADALEMGDTVRGILLTHGLVEAQRIGVALGGEPSTFTGLAGVGDLIPRSVTSTDRHHEVGRKLACQEPLADALSGVGGEVEGVTTALEAAALAKRLRLSAPLMSAIARVLSNEQDAKTALEDVLQLDDIELGHGLASPAP